MRIADISALVIDEVLRTWRRRLIAGAVIAVFALAAIIEVMSAARLTLDLYVGPIGARLILAAVFVCVIAACALAVLRAERREAAERAAKPFGGEAQVNAIAEAIHLGYSIARDFRRGSRSQANGADAADAGAPPPRPDDPGPEPDPSSVRERP